MNKKKILILGGGIGGLLAAHKLSKYTSFDITIIDKNEYLGGEHVLFWHILTNDKYILELLNDIDVNSYLKSIEFTYALNDFNYSEATNPLYNIFANPTSFISGYKNIYKKKPPIKDIIHVFFIHKYALSICNERLETYDKILWRDYIYLLSSDVKQYILNLASVYLRMDYKKISVYTIFNLIRGIKKVKKNDISYVCDILIKPWKTYLEKSGVKFLLSHKVTKIYYINDLTTISTINIVDKKNNIKKILTSDIFINAMNIKHLSNLYPVNLTFNELYQNSKYIDIQVNYLIDFSSYKPTVLILPESKWLLMMQKTSFGLLVCIGIYDRPGINGKYATDCNKNELAAECWNQIKTAKHDLILHDMPQYSVYNSKDAVKISNNINTLYLRPTFIDKKIKNLYHATNYVKNTTNKYNIESACESGSKVANLIINKYILKNDIDGKCDNYIRKIDSFFFYFSKYNINGFNKPDIAP